MLMDFTKERYDIIIQAGQSNSEGRGFGDSDHPYEPDERIWMMDGRGCISIGGEYVRENWVVAYPALTFAKRYIEAGLLEEGRKILIVRSAVGATGFCDHRWGMEDDLYHRMLEMTQDALDLNKDNRLVFFFWHQGETDAEGHSDYQTYYDNLYRLVTSTRKHFHMEFLPFIAGEFVREWISLNQEIAAPIMQATRDVCKEVGYAGFVTSENLLSNGAVGSRADDFIHFCRDASYELGRRYFDVYQKILSAAK